MLAHLGQIMSYDTVIHLLRMAQAFKTCGDELRPIIPQAEESMTCV